jgi:hypothetical protein
MVNKGLTPPRGCTRVQTKRRWRAPMLAALLPLWGGVTGGGSFWNRAKLVTAAHTCKPRDRALMCASCLFKGARPPPLTPPHKGKGDFYVAANESLLKRRCLPPSSPLWGGVRGGGRAQGKEAHAQADRWRMERPFGVILRARSYIPAFHPYIARISLALPVILWRVISFLSGRISACIRPSSCLRHRKAFTASSRFFPMAARSRAI